MNSKLRIAFATTLALGLAACKQGAESGTQGPAPAGEGSAAAVTADASDSLNCKIEMINGTPVSEDKAAAPQDVRGALEVSGWVMLQNARHAPANVVVEILQGAKVAREGVASERAPRPDVDSTFSAEGDTKAGYVFRESAPGLADGDYELRIVGGDSGQRFACSNTVRIRVSAPTQG